MRSTSDEYTPAFARDRLGGLSTRPGRAHPRRRARLGADGYRGRRKFPEEKHSVLAGAPGRPSRHLDVGVARGRPVWMDLREILNFRLGQWSVAASVVS